MQIKRRLRNILPAILALLTAGQGCQGSEGGTSDEPIHMHVVCQGHGDDNEVAGEDSERRSALEAWVSEGALFRPYSTFTIWRVGSNRQDYRPYFTACVPPSWGPGVMEAKAAFLRKAREEARTGGAAFPQGCTPPGPEAPGMDRLRLSGAIPMSSELWPPVSPHPALEGPLHVSVVCDWSNSTRDMGCTKDRLVKAFDRWMAEGLAATDSSFSIYLVGRSTGSVRRAYTLPVPKRSLGEKASFLIGARNELAGLLSDTPEENASAIAEAISIAVQEMREQAGRYRLDVLSDLRQYTPGRWNFEHSVPDAPKFIDWLRTERLFADLKGVPVTVSGVHHLDSSARLVAQMRETWESALQAMGAAEIKMFSK